LTAIFIENDALRVGVTPAYGARVVSLFHKASGREWMTEGGESPNTGEDVRYWGAEAVGWDECFPTVSVWDASATPFRRKLRDHGDVWGRPWQVDSRDATSVAATYADSQFRFSRALRLDGPTLVADYAAENLTGAPLPYLWALHALLAAVPQDTMELPVDSVRAVFLMQDGKMAPAGTMSWTRPSDALPFVLAQAQPGSSNFMGKLYAENIPGRSATIGHPGARLEIAWDDSIAHLGIWITYAAWPNKGDHYEIALEPTNAPSDHVGQTIADGYPPLAPGERRTWQVRLTASA
jgi:galactose mutarotase-like enzyme